MELLLAVRAVAKGDGYLYPSVSDAVLSDYRRHVTDPLDLLSSREREVLKLIAEGKTNKDIATLLNLSVHTVDAHRGRIMEKLNLHTTGELVRFAVVQGFHGFMDGRHRFTSILLAHCVSTSTQSPRFKSSASCFSVNVNARTCFAASVNCFPAISRR